MEHPILVSGPLIQPIQQDLKTVTRRLARLGVINHVHNGTKLGDWALSEFLGMEGREAKWRLQAEVDSSISASILCPYGQPGDRLWVRENWWAHKRLDDKKPAEIYPQDIEPLAADLLPRYGYMADGPVPDYGGKVRPSIHMPRWISRITLEVTSIGLEHLQDISVEDMKAEGVEVRQMSLYGLTAEEQRKVYLYAFQNLWTEINDEASWNLNPWVWVIRFKRLTNV